MNNSKKRGDVFVNVFDLCASISLDTRDYESCLKSAGQKSSAFGDVLKANLTSEAIISGVKKLASVVSEIGKAAYESYSEYEQLAGGAELMFGEAYNTVAKNAKNAYKTVQMSQNEYLAQVNGLATGLKTALGGNAEAAADLAHKVLTAEADVVAATGNAKEAVQNAFNGIMKSNYTMLDNLQLGITPTKEGFQELIDKVNEWNTANGRATNYTIDNVADAQAALVDYIEMQGLAGYAANEAADTIEGSTASMKAAWQNLAAGMADETADMEELTQNFVDSVGTAAKNIIPRIEQIVTGVGTATVETVSYLRDTNSTIDLVITAIEDVGIAAATAGTIMAGDLAGKAVKNVATVFIANAEALSFFTVESGKAAVAEATLNGTFSVGEVAVGVLTGKISLATAAQYAWNTAMNANPIGLLITLCAGLAVAVNKINQKSKEQIKTLVGTAESSAEAAAKVEDLKKKISDLENAGGGWTYERTQQIHGYKLALKEAESQLAALTDTETAAKVASGELTAQSIADAELMQTAAETYVAAVEDVVSDYYSTYNSIYTSLYNASTLFTEKTTAVETTADDIRENLEANTKFYESYSENLSYVTDAADAAEVNMDGLLQVLEKMDASKAAGAIAAIRQELETAGGADTEEGVQLLEKWMDDLSRYGEAIDSVSEPLALAVAETEAKLEEVEKTFTETVENLDKGAEAIEAGQNTMEGLMDGITSGSPQVLTALDSLATQMQSKLKQKFDNFVLNIQAIVSTTNGSHKSGLSYVPFDGYIAELHKGERVLTAEEATAYRAGKNSESKNIDITINQYIESVPQTPVELASATAAYFEQARWVM